MGQETDHGPVPYAHATRTYCPAWICSCSVRTGQTAGATVATGATGEVLVGVDGQGLVHTEEAGQVQRTPYTSPTTTTRPSHRIYLPYHSDAVSTPHGKAGHGTVSPSWTASRRLTRS